LVGPVGQCRIDGSEEPFETAVDVDGQSETAGGFECHKAVQGGSQGSDGVDAVVAVEVVAGKDVCDDLYDGPVGGFGLGAPAPKLDMRATWR
jgi:hypothetical protein